MYIFNPSMRFIHAFKTPHVKDFWLDWWLVSRRMFDCLCFILKYDEIYCLCQEQN
jgi:hypothetical protein